MTSIFNFCSTSLNTSSKSFSPSANRQQRLISAIPLARHWLQAVHPLLIRLRRRGTIVSSNSQGRVISRAGQRSGGIFAEQRNSERALKRARRDGSSGRFNSKLQFGLCQTTLKRITHGRRWPNPIEYSGHVHARVYHSRFTRDGARPQRESSRACSERNTRNRACTSNLSLSLSLSLCAPANLTIEPIDFCIDEICRKCL